MNRFFVFSVFSILFLIVNHDYSTLILLLFGFLDAARLESCTCAGIWAICRRLEAHSRSFPVSLIRLALITSPNCFITIFSSLRVSRLPKVAFRISCISKKGFVRGEDDHFEQDLPTLLPRLLHLHLLPLRFHHHHLLLFPAPSPRFLTLSPGPRP